MFRVITCNYAFFHLLGIISWNYVLIMYTKEMKIISRNCTYFRVSEYSITLETLVVKVTKKV